MNIGYLIKFKWHPPGGGAPGHAYQVASNLTKRGHHLHTIYYHHPNPLVKTYRQRQLFQFLNAIDVLYIRVDGDFGYEVFTLLKLLRLKRLPVVWEINSPLEELLARRKTEAHVKKLHARRAFLARFVDAAICVSKENQVYAQKELNIKNAYVVPNGSDPELFSPAQRNPSLYQDVPGKFKLIWSGSAEYAWHGIDLINAIATKIYELDKGIAFILIGKQDELMNGRQWTPNVRILGRKEYSEIPKFIASADAGLCLYTESAKGKFYFSPLKLFDYMASGLPVIATEVGQIKDVIEPQKNGILVDNNVERIVENILYLKNNTSEAKQMGLIARKKVEEFYNWGRVGEQTQDILEKVIHGK